MRDPSGCVDLSGDKVLRSLYDVLPREDFLETSCASELVASRALVAFQIGSDRKEIYSEKVGFVTYPHEWCNEQLSDAAALTLTISEEALGAGFELKDASAWNVIFNGARPVFCDHLSFKKIDSRQWWAFAQFVRHFVYPLVLARFRKLLVKDAFKLSRDGLSPELARDILGLRRFATRYWPLMIVGNGAALGAAPKATKSMQGVSFHKNLYALLRWLLKGALPRDVKSTWGEYTQERAHYSDSASEFKRLVVGRWLNQCSPKWAVDFGCNTGEFSELAIGVGAQVVAVDLDHEAVLKLYRKFKVTGDMVYPVVANLDDLSGGRGWAGREFPGLVARMAGLADMVMMLALIHHLAISSSVPYLEIAQLAAQVTNDYLIVELLDASDPLVGVLAAQRDRKPEEFSLEKQRVAFLSFFDIVEEQPVPGSRRLLCLMKKRLV